MLDTNVADYNTGTQLADKVVGPMDVAHQFVAVVLRNNWSLGNIETVAAQANVDRSIR